MKKQNKNTTPKTNTTPKVENPSPIKTNIWLPAIILAIFAFLLYTNTLQHDYALDDYSVIKDNRITKQGTAGIYEILTTEYRKGYWNSPGTLYRPLSMVMFAIEWELAPDKPFLGHLVNVLLFALTSLILFRFLTKILQNYPLWLSFLITALFVAHPIHTEVVANIKSRDEILAFLFSLLTLQQIWKYTESKSIFSLGLAVFYYFLALLSKESAITFLAIIPLVLYFFQEKTTFGAVAKNVGLLIIPTIIFFVLRDYALHNIETVSKADLGKLSLDDVSALDSIIAGQEGATNKFAMALCMAGVYLKTLFLPYPLISDLGYNQLTISGLFDWKVILSALLYLFILGYAIKTIRQKNLIAFGILFYLVTFSISSNIFVIIGTGYGERLMYAPSLGFIIALVAVFYHFFEKNNTGKNTFLSSNTLTNVVLLGLTAFFAIATILRNPVWKDSYTLYETDVLKAPNCVKLNYHYALELTKKGRDNQNLETKKAMLQRAITYFKKATDIYPKYPDALGELGLAYYYLGDRAKAMEYFDKTVALQPSAKVWSNMGMIFFDNKNLPEAQRVYEKSIALDPKFVDARRNLGSVFAMQGKFQEAIVQYKEAIKHDPNQAILYFFLGSAYRDSGDAANGQIYLDKAAKMGHK